MKTNRREFSQLCGGAVVSGMLSNPLSKLGMAGQVHGNAENSQKVIIDTDPGVDDAFALFLALRSRELKVLAVTAVAGNVPLNVTLPNALRLVEITGRNELPRRCRSLLAADSEAGHRCLCSWQQWFGRRPISGGEARGCQGAGSRFDLPAGAGERG